jgi:hypothetical protein
VTPLGSRAREPLRRLRLRYRELTAGARGLPAALIVGAQKGGTTSLFTYLAQHPGVLPPLSKEIHYFELNYARGAGWYRARFPYARRLRDAITLDASPYYLAHPLVPERAARLLPDVRIIVLLRNPVDRAFSHYQHEVRGGRESLSFADAVDREPERLAGEEERLRADPTYYSYNHHRYSYLLRGRYIDQLRRWLAYFPRDRMLVVQSERLFQDPAETTAAVNRFLGLAAWRLPRYDPVYPGQYTDGIAGPLRSRLVRYFEPYNRALYAWLGEEYDWA